MNIEQTSKRAGLFRYVALDVSDTTLHATYDLDGRIFEESVTFEGCGPLNTPSVIAVAQLWFLIAGLSYYKAGAARHVNVGTIPFGARARDLLRAAINDGLGEFAYRNDLDLRDVVISGGVEPEVATSTTDRARVLVPFGGGIDSVVTTSQLAPALEQTLFIVSPLSGRFEPLESTATVANLDVVRATRSIDEQILKGGDTFYHGHVPVTAMVTLLAAVAALASGRGGVVMSNEHSSSVANLRWNDMDVNHQWSKSLAAEELIGAAIEERVGDSLVVASFLRNRSEVWVARVFSQLTQYHGVFRSCNRAFSQVVDQRLDAWCGECDKCLFINLVLAPYLSREALFDIFKHEPLSDSNREAQLRVLVGSGVDFKPFECVGDPEESGASLLKVRAMSEWADVALVQLVANDVSPDASFESLLTAKGPSRVPAHWLR